MCLDPTDPRFSFAAHGGYEKTSEATPEYNCIAWAAEDTTRFWWPDQFMTGYWPDGAPREVTVDAFVRTFEFLGYTLCADEAFRSGYQKVAILAKNNEPTHAARQLAVGPHRAKWSSKMGRSIDIVHDLKAVLGRAYGTIAAVLERAIRAGPV